MQLGLPIRWARGRRPIMLVALVLACAPAAAPVESPRPTVSGSQPEAREQVAAQPGAVEEYRPDGGGIGVPQCDAYLELYRRCEPELAAEIAAGNRRSARAEAGWLEYVHEHERDAGLPQACEAMLTALRGRCGP